MRIEKTAFKQGICCKQSYMAILQVKCVICYLLSLLFLGSYRSQNFTFMWPVQTRISCRRFCRWNKKKLEVIAVVFISYWCYYLYYMQCDSIWGVLNCTKWWTDLTVLGINLLQAVNTWQVWSLSMIFYCLSHHQTALYCAYWLIQYSIFVRKYVTNVHTVENRTAIEITVQTRYDTITTLK